VNPAVLNPDPLAILKEANRIYDPTKQPRSKDGFTIIDGNRDPKGGGWTSDSQQADSIKKNFDYTADNFNEAKIRAAREGKPLVVVVGKNNAETKQLVDGVIPGAKNGPRSAIYVYAEMSKLDQNPELSKAVGESKGDPNRPYTAIFAPRAMADGTPGLERHIANTWGARSEIANIIQDQVGSAQSTMDMRRGTFILPPEGQKPPGAQTTPADTRPGQTSDRTAPQVKPEISEAEKQRKAEYEAEARVAPLAKTVVDSFKQLKGSDYKQRESLYAQAEKAASQLNPQDVALVKQKTARDLQAEMAKGDAADPKQVGTLKARQTVLDLMSNAPAWTRLNHGISQMHFSQFDDGIAKIKEGGQLNPGYLNNPQFIEQLMRTPYNLDVLKEKLPEVKFDEYLKHKKAGTVDQFVAEQKAQEKEAEPQVKPPEVKPDAKPETAIKQPEKLHYDGSEYEKSLEDGFNAGRLIVAKVGTKGCTGCDDMTAQAWPDARVQQQLKDKAIFTDIDGAKRTDLVDSLNAGSWPTVLVIEPYKDPASGKILGRVVNKIEPTTADGRSATSLNQFLTDNLTAPKPQPVVKPQETVRPQETVQPQVTPPDATPQPEVRPEAPRQTNIDESDKATFARLTLNHRKIRAPLEALNEKSDPATIDKAFETAIQNAKEVNPQDIARAKQVLEASKQAIAAGLNGAAPNESTLAELKKLDADMSMITRIEQSEGYLNISRGAVRLKMNPDNPELGKADIKAGLALRPELAQNDAVKAKLASTGYDATTLNSWFPELKLPTDVQPDVPVQPQAADPAKSFERLREQHAKNLQPFADLPENATEEQVSAAFQTAIKNAGQVDLQDVRVALTALETRRQTLLTDANGGQLTEGAQAELGQIDQDMLNYINIAQADGLLHIGNGVRKLVQDRNNPAQGIADIRQGLALRPGLKNDPTLIDRLKTSGYDEQTLLGWFPELAQQQGPQAGPDQNRPKLPPARR